MTSVKPAIIMALAAITLSPLQAADRENGLPGDAEPLRISIDEAVELALEKSFRLSRSRRNLESAEARIDQAEAAYWPRVGVELYSSQSRRGLSGDRRGGLDPQFAGNIYASASLPIDIRGVIGRQVKQARLSRQAAEIERQGTLVDLNFEVRTAYMSALRAQSILAVDEENVVLVADLLSRSRRSAPAAVPFLEVELATARQAAIGSRQVLDSTLDHLKQALRLSPETVLELTTGVAASTERLSANGVDAAQAVKDRTDARQAEIRIDQARLGIQQADDYLEPSLRIGAYYNASVFGEYPHRRRDQRNFNDGGIFITLIIPLVRLDGGFLNAARKQAQIQWEQSLADLDEARERIQLDIRQALLQLQRAETRLMTLPSRTQSFRALQQAEEALLSAPPQQMPGAMAQVSNARASFHFTETTAIDAYAEYNLAAFRLLRAMGLTRAPADQDQAPLD